MAALTGGAAASAQTNISDILRMDAHQLSQAIGKGGRNVRLASKLAAWEIDIYELGGDSSAPASTSAGAAEPPVEGGAAKVDSPTGEVKVEATAPPSPEAPTPQEEKKNEG